MSIRSHFRAFLDSAALALVFVSLSVAPAFGASPTLDSPSPPTIGALQPITGPQSNIIATPTTQTYGGIVELTVPGGVCTGTLLSEHWVLTAAHCVLGHVNYGENVGVWYAPQSDGNANVKVYDGPAQGFVHPNNDGGERDDFGLIHLLSYGINSNTTQIGRAQLYIGAAESLNTYEVPLTSYLAGYGLGSDPGGSTDCRKDNPDLVLYFFRSSAGVQAFFLYDYPQKMFTVSPVICYGDSGGPWMLRVGSPWAPTSIQYAVSSHLEPGSDWLPPLDEAGVLTPDVIDWIENTMAYNMPRGFYLWFWDSSSVWVDDWYGREFPYRFHAEFNETQYAPITIQGMCLDLTGPDDWDPVTLAYCQGGTSQQWWLTPTGEIRNGSNPGKCLDVRWGSTDYGTPMQLFTCNGTLAQRFRFGYDGLLRSGLNFDKCVDVPWASIYAGAQPWLWDCNGTIAQVWDH